MTDRHPAYQLLLEISDQLRNMMVERKIVEEKIKYNALVRNDTGRTTITVKNLDWANLSVDCLEGCSTATKLFVLDRIIPSIRKYNLLWHWPTPSKRTEKMVIKELVERKILFRTEAIGIYLVNPIKIWKGNPLTCVEATKALIREHRKPSVEIIKDLRPGDKYEHSSSDGYDLLTNNGLTPNLLEENSPGYSLL